MVTHTATRSTLLTLHYITCSTQSKSKNPFRSQREAHRGKRHHTRSHVIRDIRRTSRRELHHCISACCAMSPQPHRRLLHGLAFKALSSIEFKALYLCCCVLAAAGTSWWWVQGRCCPRRPAQCCVTWSRPAGPAQRAAATPLAAASWRCQRWQQHARSWRVSLRKTSATGAGRKVAHDCRMT
jgi:hypothetical protein